MTREFANVSNLTRSAVYAVCATTIDTVQIILNNSKEEFLSFLISFMQFLSFVRFELHSILL